MTPSIRDASPAILRPFWSADVGSRLTEFAAMRTRSGGVEHHVDERGAGLWSLTSHEAVSQVSRDPVTFTSTAGFSLDDFPREVLDVMASIIAMDDPQHGVQRRLVQSAFSPRAITRLTESVDRMADVIVDELRDRRDFDFVEAVGANLPLQVICDLLDITSVLMHAEIDGRRLTAAEFGSFVVLLVSAGNDTTRTALTWGMKLLSDHPEQKRLLRHEFDGRHVNAIDEILRWCAPALHMRRTATADAVIAGKRISKGDRVVLWYLAANHDPSVFTDPDCFDIERVNARDHIAFGAGGPHFCLGSNLAKMEMRVVLQKILAAFPDIHATAPPALLVSPFVHTIKSLPCSIG